ncbi:membralin-like isoform X1 [Argiope bruennichi]|uniref:Membralin like protein n=1 Tax=Argiope bruennichi TaxID=94029 RepID=A0A8T0EPS8_ARGBR|nr:membralin-like isoform X1 [Argiope bruennichi]XP_055949715.1 membralin-like isoform X1 [Argiope bruennichi]KAF8774545.1 Membralin like protein [Argiope bruennichi]
MPDHLHPVQQLFLAMEMVPMEDHASNNNNQNSLWQLRDRLFQVLFERATLSYASIFPPGVRKLMEVGLLTLAVISLFILVYVHFAFVKTPVNCLEKEIRTWSREGVLRIEISTEETTTQRFNLSIFYNNSIASHLDRIRQEQKTYYELLRKKKAMQRAMQKAAQNAMREAVLNNNQIVMPLNKISELKKKSDEDFAMEFLKAYRNPIFVNGTILNKNSISDPDCFTPLTTTISETEYFENKVWHFDKYIIEYSLEYGFLRLSPGARQNTSVKVHTVILDPLKHKCFGNEFSRFLLQHVLGYNDILMGSLRYLVDRDQSKGFVRNVITGDQYRFVDKSATWTAYLSAAVFMIIFTLSVSMLLRYSHHQIFIFVVELLHIMEVNTVTFPAAPLLTVVLALVGMEAIMSEFFNDSVTAFYIIIIVWMADQFDSICCRTAVSKKHWLRLFYLYHYAFYAYHYRFNGQYSFLALVTSWLFIQHSMVYFFHEYELPAIWNAMENETDYDSDGSYSFDNYLLPSDGSLADDEDDSNFQETSAPSQESSFDDNIPTSSEVTDSGDTSYSHSSISVAKRR